MKLKLVLFDIEVLKNCWICCCKIVGGKYITFEISERRNDLEDLIAFFKDTSYAFVGYNCSHYDTPIINMMIMKSVQLLKGDYLVTTEAAFKLSDKIINGDVFSWNEYKWANIFTTIDLMTMMASKALRVGLKSLQVTMCYRNVKEMEVDWKQPIGVNDINSLIHYCGNDIDSTGELLSLMKNDLQLRKDIQKEFGIQCISKDGVGIGVDIFTRYICEELHISNAKMLMEFRENYDTIVVKDFLLDEIQFKTDNLKKVREFYANMILDAAGVNTLNGTPTHGTVIINKLKHAYGIGGLHSVNKPGIYVEDDEYVIVDSDVAGMYPTMADMWNFAPKGMKKAFLTVLRKLKALRLEAKRNKISVKDKTYKLALNSILGHLRNEYGPYYGPEANIGICVNGQLFLLMLIERCELAGIQCISSNTDGITMRIKRSQLDEYYQFCKEWEAVSRMELEHVSYEKIVIVAVNDYVAYKKGYSYKKGDEEVYVPGYSDLKDKLVWPSPADWIEYNYSYVKSDAAAKLIDSCVKMKGMFISYSRLGKGLDSVIVSKALIDYFGKGTPVEDTIRGSTDIWDFISFQKIGKQFQVMWQEEKQQQINRFYASRKGGYLMKRKRTEKRNSNTGINETKFTDSHVKKDSGIQIMNEYVKKPMNEYGINYSYYISKANDVIKGLEPEQLALF